MTLYCDYCTSGGRTCSISPAFVAPAPGLTGDRGQQEARGRQGLQLRLTPGTRGLVSPDLSRHGHVSIVTCHHSGDDYRD